ncbi:M48 family metallopeptidase [Patescibacteria group bacterium]
MLKKNKQLISYIIRDSSRARQMNITVKRDGQVIVTKPRWISRRRAASFVIEKQAWIAKKQAELARRADSLLGRHDVRHYQQHKTKARQFVFERLEYFNSYYNFRYNRISIRNQRTRWGSCSRRKNLNFNYKLLLLPRELADYIVVHELCHLAELNHSARFWKLVARVVPEHRELRKKLRQIS